MKKIFSGFCMVILSVSLNAQKANDVCRIIDDYINKSMAEWGSPGLAIAIVKDDAIIFSKGYGRRKMGEPLAVDENTIFAVGSQTKSFTAAAIALLVDEGKLKWDDPVVKYIPEFQLSDPWITSRLTIRDCLSHRLGFDPLDLLWLLTDFKRDELVRRYKYAKPINGFRSSFEYNNMMILLAGEVIPRITGKSWDEFVKQRFFLPLHMKNSTTSTADLFSNMNSAAPYEIIDGKIQPVNYRNTDNIGSAGAINSTVLDMANWIRFQLGNGLYDGLKILSPESMKEMHSPQTIMTLSKLKERPQTTFSTYAYLNSTFLTYGLGWFIQDYKKHVLIHHGGDDDGMRCQVGLIPELNLGLVVFSNLHPGTLVEAIMYRVFDAFIDGEERDWSSEFLLSINNYNARMAEAQKQRMAQFKEKVQPTLGLDKYSGSYENEIYGLATIAEKKGSLMIQFGQLSCPLVHMQSDTFIVSQHVMYVGRIPISFVLTEEDKIAEFKLFGGIRFKRISN
jgi:CubicO group peptidase (beta-lactamase class C family)